MTSVFPLSLTLKIIQEKVEQIDVMFKKFKNCVKSSSRVV